MDLFFNRENKRKEPRRAGKARWKGALMIAAVLCLGGLISIYWRAAMRVAGSAREAFLSHPYFSVREIRVKGGEKLGGSEIAAIAGLTRGMNLWRIDPLSMEKKVARHPWVRRVVVRREFPHRIVIEVEERVPKGIVIIGRLYYVDADGFVFKQIKQGENVDYPLITGLPEEALASQSPLIRRKIQDALRLSALMEKLDLGVSEISFYPHDGLVVYPMRYPVALSIGWGDWTAKLEKLQRVLALWNGHEHRLAALDLNFRNQVVAKLKGQELKRSRSGNRT
ncbi:MAG: FtsQ-type POTRA domain-containing protein [Deltaproteobacteria bacterium]|nr:FtsQ-type POTRA domain-containing protein [Deltaproteobacteria bacterium]